MAKKPILPKDIDIDPLKDMPYNPELIGNEYGPSSETPPFDVDVDMFMAPSELPPEQTFQQPQWWERIFLNKKPDLATKLTDLLRMQEEINALAKGLPQIEAQREFNRLNKKEK